MSQLHRLTALEQATAIRNGTISSVELTKHYLGRIAEHDQDLGAFVTVAGEQALAAAAEADRAVRSSRSSLPPLHGVPTGVKDLNLVAGLPVAFGSTVFRDFVAPSDDNVTVRIRHAGMPILGKTSTPEFGAAIYTEPVDGRPTRNPWDLKRSAGGSSGGAAAAVAAGLLPIAHASDSAGSVRLPASFCGLVGVKPSRGRVSSGPVGAEAIGLFANGLVARRVLDAAAFLDVMAGSATGDPWWGPPQRRPFTTAAREFDQTLRIGLYRAPPLDGGEVHPDCLAAADTAAELFAARGHHVDEIRCPFPGETEILLERLFAMSAAMAPVMDSAEHLLEPLTRWLRAQAARVSGPALLQTVAAAQALARQVLAAVSSYDVLLSPTTAQPGFEVGSLQNPDDPAASFQRQKEINPFAAAYNLTGQPAFSLPVQVNRDGLPVGAMIAAKPGGESVLFGLSLQLEDELQWQERYPPSYFTV